MLQRLSYVYVIYMHQEISTFNFIFHFCSAIHLKHVETENKVYSCRYLSFVHVYIVTIVLALHYNCDFIYYFLLKYCFSYTIMLYLAAQSGSEGLQWQFELNQRTIKISISILIITFKLGYSKLFYKKRVKAWNVA